ncbi:MAG TPA: NUDIX hydrolase [Microlunatus sp.]|nr:NUDIX hydrolase [Microlunatus sp.]
MPSHSLDVLSSLSPAVPVTLAELAEAAERAEAGPASGRPVTPRPAASVVLCRDGDAGLETFLLHRHARMAFAASMVVFPGGGLDPVDRSDEDPRRACAVRETLEETGVSLPAADLVPWAHWITPILQPIRYDTYFYLAPLPPGEVAGDLSTETERAAWTAPASAVSAYRNGVLAMMPPTLSILLELAELSSVAEAIALGAGRLIETVLPEVVRRGDGWMFRYPPSRTSAGG